VLPPSAHHLVPRAATYSTKPVVDMELSGPRLDEQTIEYLPYRTLNAKLSGTLVDKEVYFGSVGRSGEIRVRHTCSGTGARKSYICDS